MRANKMQVSFTQQFEIGGDFSASSPEVWMSLCPHRLRKLGRDHRPWKWGLIAGPGPPRQSQSPGSQLRQFIPRPMLPRFQAHPSLQTLA